MEKSSAISRLTVKGLNIPTTDSIPGLQLRFGTVAKNPLQIRHDIYSAIRQPSTSIHIPRQRAVAERTSVPGQTAPAKRPSGSQVNSQPKDPSCKSCGVVGFRKNGDAGSTGDDAASLYDRLLAVGTPVPESRSPAAGQRPVLRAYVRY